MSGSTRSFKSKKEIRQTLNEGWRIKSISPEGDEKLWSPKCHPEDNGVMFDEGLKTKTEIGSKTIYMPTQIHGLDHAVNSIWLERRNARKGSGKSCERFNQ